MHATSLLRKAALFVALSSATSDFVYAQDSGAGFITSCPAGTWALTFDDGPSSFTPELLGYLKDANVKATFFVLGVQMSQANLAANTKLAFDAGHMIAAHTFDHTDLNTLQPAAIRDQMTKTEDLIKKTIGLKPAYMRPPYGNCNAACASVMKELQYSVTTWNVDSNDWRVVGTPNEEDAFKAFTTTLAKPNAAATGYNSLQHDIHHFSVQMVPRIIKAIQAGGMKFVTIDQCGKTPAYKDGQNPAASTTPSAGSPTSGNGTASTSPTPSLSPSTTKGSSASTTANARGTGAASTSSPSVGSAAVRTAGAFPASAAFAGLLFAGAAVVSYL